MQHCCQHTLHTMRSAGTIRTRHARHTGYFQMTFWFLQAFTQPQAEVLYHVIAQPNSRDAVHSMLGMSRQSTQAANTLCLPADSIDAAVLVGGKLLKILLVVVAPRLATSTTNSERCASPITIKLLCYTQLTTLNLPGINIVL